MLHIVSTLLLLYFVDNSLLTSLTELQGQQLMIDGASQEIEDHLHILDTMEKLMPLHFFVFSTGANCVPASGWPCKPSITFEHNAKCSFMRASTRSLKVTIPVTEATRCIDTFMYRFAVSLLHDGTFSDI